MPSGFWLTALIALAATLIFSGMRARRIGRRSLRITSLLLLATLSVLAVSASVIAIAGMIKATQRSAPIPHVRIDGTPEQVRRGAAIADGFCGACHIFRAIRNGVDAQGNWLTIMTYTNVNHLSDADIAALIAYLRSRPATGEPTVNPPDQLQPAWANDVGRGDPAQR